MSKQKKNSFRQLTAAALALLICSGYAPAVANVPRVDLAITASADTITVNHVDVQETDEALNFTGSAITLHAKAYKAVGTDAADEITDATFAWAVSENNYIQINASTGEITYKDGVTALPEDADVNVTVTVTATKGESSETGTATVVVKKAEAQKYTVILPSSLTNGTVTANPTTAAAGSTVTLTITPSSGYELSTISVTDANSNVISLTVSGNTRTFIMPAANVTVSATFTATTVPVSNVTLNKTTLTLEEGESETLTATVTPTTATNKTVTWKSSDTAVATVANGKVTAVKAGTATITATAGGKSVTCALIVNAKSEVVTKYTVTNNLKNMTSDGAAEASADEDYTATFTAAEGYVLPEKVSVKIGNSEAKDYTLTNGKITIAKADITGDIVITGEAVAELSVKSVVIDADNENTVKVGDEITLKVTVIMSDDTVSTSQTVVLTAGNDNISVDGLKIKGVKAGTSTVTAKVGEVSSEPFAITVEEAAKKFSVTYSLKNMKSTGASEARDDEDFTASFTASEGYDLPEKVSVKIGEGAAKDYTLTNGSLTISKAEITGNIVITGEAKKAPDVSSITLSKSTAILKPNGEISLKADVTMSDGSAYKGTPAIEWTSSDSAVASVDNSGNVKAIAAGTADITAKIGGLSAVCKVTVNAPDAVGVKSVTINKAAGKITVGDTVKLEAVITTTDGSKWSEAITWTSDNTSVATVSSSGVVTAKAAGTTTITAEAGGVKDTYTITVTDFEKEITTSGTTVTFAYGDTYEYTGAAIKPVVMVLDKDGKLLAEGTDYSVTYKNNKNAGTASAVVKGLNAHKTDIATTNLSFTITRADISGEKADAPAIGFVYKNGKAQTAAPVLYFNGKKLTAGKDFTVSSDDTNVTVKNGKQISVTGTADGETYSITLTGQGNYEGERTVDVVVHPSSVKMYKTSTLTVKVSPTKYVYDANGVEPTFTIKDKSGKTYSFTGENCDDPDVPFEVTLSNNAEVGKGTITITPTDDNETYYGTKTVTFTITQKGQLKNYITVTNVKVKAKADGDAWTLEELLDAAQSGTLTGTIKISDEITLGEDFEVQYQKNTKKGTAKIIFIGINGYAGQKVTKTFKITQ